MISEDLVKPIPMLEEMVKRGEMGRKSGKGFYDVSWPRPSVQADTSQYDSK